MGKVGSQVGSQAVAQNPLLRGITGGINSFTKGGAEAFDPDTGMSYSPRRGEGQGDVGTAALQALKQVVLGMVGAPQQTGIEAPQQTKPAALQQRFKSPQRAQQVAPNQVVARNPKLDLTPPGEEMTAAAMKALMTLL
jgi:hypothetical protein